MGRLLHRSSTTRAAATVLIGTAAVIASCQAPTQVTVELQTNVAYRPGMTVAVTAGRPETINPAEPSAVRDDAWGPDGSLGSLVLVPDKERDGPLAVVAVLGVTKPTAACNLDDPQGCIVVRRRLKYVPHRSLRLPIGLFAGCEGVKCAEDATCNQDGQCVSAAVDPDTCEQGEGCFVPGDAPLGRPPPPGFDGAVPIDAGPVDGGDGAVAPSCLSQGPKLAQLAGTGGWFDPTFALVADGKGAWGDSNSNPLLVAKFGFTIPATAKIRGVAVEVLRRADGPAIRDGLIALRRDNGQFSASRSKPADWAASSTFTSVSYGGPTDLWDGTWTPADVNAEGFGFALGVAGDFASAGYVDVVRMTVHYCP